MELLGPKARKTMIKVKMIKLIELGKTFTSRELAEKLDVKTLVVSGILRGMVNEGCLSRTRGGYNVPNKWKLPNGNQLKTQMFRGTTAISLPYLLGVIE